MGTGHVMRCLALAQTWALAGAHAELLGQLESNLRLRVESSGIPSQSLDAAHPHPTDVDLTVQCLRTLGEAVGRKPWLVLDGYQFDVRYQQAIREAGFRLLVLDDYQHLPRYEADVLLNQNAGADRLDYATRPETLLLLGPRWALLRPEFLARDPSQREPTRPARRLLVTMGGADPENATSTALRALGRPELSALEVVALLGVANPHGASLQSTARDIGMLVRVVKDPSDIPALMAWADVAISAAGSTCWELCFMGLPTIVVALAKNQLRAATDLAEAGAAVSLGWFENVTPERLRDELISLCANPGRRAELSQHARALVDGRGAKRVAAIMAALEGGLSGDEVTIRPAAVEDLFDVWRLANDPVVRANSFSPQRIPLEEHERWYRKRLADPAGRFWLLAVGGVSIGQVRYATAQPDCAEVHFSIAPAFRGRGLGTHALLSTGQLACQELGVRRIRGLVICDNVPSARAFLKAGFEKVDERLERGRPCYVFEKLMYEATR